MYVSIDESYGRYRESPSADNNDNINTTYPLLYNVGNCKPRPVSHTCNDDNRDHMTSRDYK